MEINIPSPFNPGTTQTGTFYIPPWNLAPVSWQVLWLWAHNYGVKIEDIP